MRRVLNAKEGSNEPPPEDVLKDIETQIADPNSKLQSGEFGQYAADATVEVMPKADSESSESETTTIVTTKSNIGAFIGGVFFLLLIIAIIAICIYRKHHHAGAKGEADNTDGIGEKVEEHVEENIEKAEGHQLDRRHLAQNHPKTDQDGYCGIHAVDHGHEGQGKLVLVQRRPPGHDEGLVCHHGLQVRQRLIGAHSVVEIAIACLAQLPRAKVVGDLIERGRCRLVIGSRPPA